VYIGTVVTAVPNLIFVIVRLTGVEEKLAVVLETQDKSFRKSNRNGSPGQYRNALTSAAFRLDQMTNKDVKSQFTSPHTCFISGLCTITYIPILC
jgi:hypothetical protein